MNSLIQTIPSQLILTSITTQVGKSVTTGKLGRYLQTQGRKVITQKWVQCGGTRTEDLSVHWHHMGHSQNPHPNWLADQCPYYFKTPASPHLASAQEGIIITPDILIQSTQKLAPHFDYVLIEASGGLMTPLTQDLTFLDIIATHHIPTILVVENTLGTISQTLLAIHALTHTNAPILGIIYTQLPTTPIDPFIQKSNIDYIHTKTKLPNLTPLVE